MARSITPQQRRSLMQIRGEMQLAQQTLDQLADAAAHVVELDPNARERFDDELAWHGSTWTPEDAARWADDAESNTPPSHD